MSNNLFNNFMVAVGACEVLIRIDTDEYSDCLQTLSAVCKKFGWELRVHDVLVGVEWFTGDEPKPIATSSKPSTLKNPADLLAAVGGGMEKQVPSVIQALVDFWHEPAKPDVDACAKRGENEPGEVQPIITVFRNFHLAFERNREMAVALVQRIVSQKVCDNRDYEKTLKESLYKPHGIEGDCDTGKFVVGLMPAEATLPPEVSRLFKRLTHELPDINELMGILEDICPSEPVEDNEDNAQALSPEQRTAICKFALGLTRLQAEGLFSASMVQFGRIDPEYVWKEKSATLNKEGLVELYQGKETFKDVAGLEGMKQYMKQLLTPNEYNDDPDVRAKGVLACGPPGTGKTLIAKAIGNELGLPILMVNPANWFGQYVGQSEANTRKGFQLLQRHAPCIAIIDEVEKVMPSSRGSSGDSGVGSRMEGTFLTAMNDMKESVFWVFTANDVRKMHEAFFRAERVDGVFYVQLPNATQRAALWQLYGKKFFPKEVLVKKQLVAFPQYNTTSAKEYLAELSSIKKPNIEEWANKATLPLMCMADPAKRQNFIEKIAGVKQEVADNIKLVQDDGWSPAEIRACCRLSRVLKEPLTATQDRIRPVSVSAAKVIEYLEEWAAESALDAETGKLFVPAGIEPVEDGSSAVRRRDPKKAKRKLRKTETE